MRKPIFRSFSDRPELATFLADSFISLIEEKLINQDSVHISLTGGTMGTAILEYAGKHERIEKIDWSRVHFWWSDERFVPLGDSDRNEQQAKDALLSSLNIPSENVHTMGAADQFETPEDAARAYQKELLEYAQEPEEFPLFDLTLLGMGPDGHIASLFPGRPEILDHEHITLAIRDSPKPPPSRVTLTLPVINHSTSIWFMISGEDKNEALTRLLDAGSLSSSELTSQILRETPAAAARGTQKTLVLVDASARGTLEFA